MNASNNEILTMFEECGMTPEEIARDRGYDVLAVKTVLLQMSSKFRALTNPAKTLSNGNSPEIAFSEADELRALQVLTQIGMESEDEHLAVKAAMYVRDDRRGRRDIRNKIKNITVNVNQFNLQLQKANEALELAKASKTIDLAPSDVKQLEEKK